MSQRIVLHIGTHKTGTTAIQAFARDHEAFLAKQGLLYPGLGRPFHGEQALGVGHHLVPWLVNDHVKQQSPLWGEYRGRAQELWQPLLAAIADAPAPRALLSSESFDTLTAPQAEALAARLAGFEVTVVLYLRRLDQFVQAMYATDVANYGEKRPIETYLQAMRTPTDYTELVGRWRGAFGAERVQVKLYSHGLLRNGDVVQDFFGAIGVDIAGVRSGREQSRENRGLPWNAVLTQRAFNELDVPRAQVAVLSGILRDLYPAASAPYSLLAPARQQEMARRCAEQIRGLALPGITAAMIETFAAGDFGDEAKWQEAHGAPHAAIARTLADLRDALRARRPTPGLLSRVFGKR